MGGLLGSVAVCYCKLPAHLVAECCLIPQVCALSKWLLHGCSVWHGGWLVVLCSYNATLVARSRAGGKTKTITTYSYKLNLALKNQKTKRLVRLQHLYVKNVVKFKLTFNIFIHFKLCPAQTPTWRIKSTNPCYSMEGTEDIADQVLLKRHEKMEKEEKQRKRLVLMILIFVLPTISGPGGTCSA